MSGIMSHKPTIALQISGQQRYGKYFPQLLEAFDGFDVDIYIHNWTGIYVEQDIVRAYPDVYDIVIEDQIQFDIPKDWKKMIPEPYGSPIFNLVSMCYGIYQANLLRIKSGIKYDYVARARSDIRLVGFRSDYWASQNVIDVGIRPHFLPVGRPEIQDQFAIGTPETMNIYSELYNNLQKFHDCGGQFHPETFFYWWLKSNNITMLEETFKVEMEKIEIPRELRSIF
jgi:hypothetical protein